MATHSTILAWRIPRTEEPGGPQSMRSQELGHGLATKQPPPPPFTRGNSLKPPTPWSCETLSSPLYRGGNRGGGRLKDLPKVTQSINTNTGCTPIPLSGMFPTGLAKQSQERSYPHLSPQAGAELTW